MNKREKQKAETLADIMKASEELFTRQGYENTSIQQIADMCGITKGALYHHFRSKEEVLEKMCIDHYESMLNSTIHIIKDKSRPALARMEEVVKAMRTLGAEKSPVLSEHLKVRHGSGNVMLRERLGKYDRKFYINVVAPLLGEANDKGECSFPSPPEVIAGFIFNLDRGVTEQIKNILAMGKGNDAEKQIMDLLEGFVHALSAMLGTDIGIIRKIVSIDEALVFFRQVLGSRE